ncbi:hypothetical protein CDG76_26600 [Nostoc sp. 'Peltigera membranacea cyanobiont' 210A]|uniref:hypothetical protein n=1 Tax=Nostoc sp. 'Peltigera membranacea cyanobiont' 210A TaxID=2014529 RepID=UPI000B953F85|nr:hypothetical protein [Nostoc sp. 'Peltigera membranacea cyanobiont' 210A]OYD91475.1 hypothetical protein CDG76_26600 [Nostoc sp. 'Peltigera membranacea cyanobiont' 210A]
MEPAKIESRVKELDANLELTSGEIFDTVCGEFGLNITSLESEFGCKCPFALVGYLSECETVNHEY